MEWASKFFGTGVLPEDLERALSAQQRARMGSGALLDAGIAMLANSGYSSTPQTLGQIVGQGLGAGRQSVAAQGAMQQEAMARQQAAQQQAQRQAQWQQYLSTLPQEMQALYGLFPPEEGAKTLAAERNSVQAAKARNTGSGPRTVTPGSAVWDPETGKVLYQNPARQSDLATVDIPLPDGRTIRGQRDPQTGNVYDLNGNLISAGPRGQQQAPQNAADVIKAIEAESGVPLTAEQRRQVRDGLASGSGFNIAMPGGQPIGVQRSPEQQKEAELRAENKVLDERNKRQAADKAQIAYQTISSMLSHPGLSTATGLSGQIDPRNYIWGTEAQGARALIEQVQGQAFLQAFESLKGAGQITQVEGEKATAAIARLQRAQSDEDFRAAAEELRQIAARAYERATGQKIGQPANADDDLINKYLGQ